MYCDICVRGIKSIIFPVFKCISICVLMLLMIYEQLLLCLCPKVTFYLFKMSMHLCNKIDNKTCQKWNFIIACNSYKQQQRYIYIPNLLHAYYISNMYLFNFNYISRQSVESRKLVFYFKTIFFYFYIRLQNINYSLLYLFIQSVTYFVICNTTNNIGIKYTIYCVLQVQPQILIK